MRDLFKSCKADYGLGVSRDGHGGGLFIDQGPFYFRCTKEASSPFDPIISKACADIQVVAVADNFLLVNMAARLLCASNVHAVQREVDLSGFLGLTQFA